MKRQIVSISFVLFYAMAMFKPMLPYAVYYSQKLLNEMSFETITEEEIQEQQIGAYVGAHGRNYLSALKKRLAPITNDTHKSQLPVDFNDIPVFTYDTYKNSVKILSLKELKTSPNHCKHFVISEYSFSIFHPPKQFA